MKLEEMVGMQLMIGIPGPKLTTADIEIFRRTRAGNLIVFRPNFESTESFQKLLSTLESALGRKLLVAVDHEGGRVIHLREGVTIFPDNLALGNTKNETYAAGQGKIEAAELRRLGIDLNLAPTLDVLTADFSPNIGIRSYGNDPNLVARLGAARIRVMQASGVSACAKHFPGQGQSPLDTHVDLAVLPSTWEEMKKIHLIPFIAAIEAGVDTIMSSHPVYPYLDSGNIPATFSRLLIGDFLRKELHFEGVIFSDDLEMGALKEISSVGDSACRAVEAGHDIVLVCHQAEAQKEVFESLLKAYQTGRLKISDLEKSVERIENLKKKRNKRFAWGWVKPAREGRRLAEEIASHGLKISRNPSLLPLPAGDSVFVIFPRLSSLADKICIEEEMLDEKSFVKIFFSGFSNRLNIQTIGLSPTSDETKQALAVAQTSDAVIFFCYDAHLDHATRLLLENIQRLPIKCIVVLLRDPYDQDFVKDTSCCISIFGFRACQIKAAVSVISKNGGRN